MRLSAKIIKNYANINQFDYGSEWNVMENEASTLSLQLVDLDQDGLRYVPSDAATLVVTFPAVNSANIVTKTATRPSDLDTSVWQLTLASTDKVYSGNVQVALTDGGVTKRFVILQGIAVESLNQGGC